MIIVPKSHRIPEDTMHYGSSIQDWASSVPNNTIDPRARFSKPLQLVDGKSPQGNSPVRVLRSLRLAHASCSILSILPDQRCLHQFECLEFRSYHLAFTPVKHIECHFDHPASLERCSWLSQRIPSQSSTISRPVNPIFNPTSVA